MPMLRSQSAPADVGLGAGRATYPGRERRSRRLTPMKRLRSSNSLPKVKGKVSRTSTAVAGFAGVGTTMLVLLASSQDPSLNQPTDLPLPQASSQLPGQLAESEIEELAAILEEGLEHTADDNDDSSGAALMKNCLSSLIRVVETYHTLPTHRQKKRRLDLAQVVPRCTHINIIQQRAALRQISVLLKYHHATSENAHSTLSLATMVALLVTFPATTLAYMVLFPRLFRTTREACTCRLCRSDPATSLPLGSVIGEGGFATAYMTRERGKRCVLKMIRVDLQKSVNEAQDALDEAKSLINLRHEYIVDYRDVFLHRETHHPPWLWGGEEEVRDFVCIVMEWCNGGTLLTHSEKDAITLPEIWIYLRQMAEALAYMHKNNCVHRDIKPENVFLLQETDDDGSHTVKIGDFGLALNAVDDECEGLAACGTTAFMSPECFTQTSVDAASDVWSLGVTLYELVTCLSEHCTGLQGPLPSHNRQNSMGETEALCLCEVASADPSSWEDHVVTLRERFRSKLLELYNREFYRLKQTAEETDPDACVGAEDMAICDEALLKLPRLLASMLSFDKDKRPAAETIVRDMKRSEQQLG